MPELSLTDFVDFASAGGTSKLTKVRRFKLRPEYEPAFDFYKRLREGIVSCHAAGDAKSQLAKHVGDITDAKKKGHYADAIKGYKKWWGKKPLSWFAPPREAYSEGDVSIRVNPELGLRVDGKPHVIKLYFKADKLSKPRVDVITHLMDKALRASAPAGTTMCVLDVRNGKLIAPTVPIPDLDAVLRGEIAYLAAVWESVKT
ncbi:MAG: hypothetical protein DWQ01_15660 [Planctomycetota bacterium]|nr:MAG: hypothetical protein DWQ01_15660 [Planctomycetota bacterium]